MGERSKKMTNRRDFLKRSAALAAVAGTASVSGMLAGCSGTSQTVTADSKAGTPEQESKRPNIVFFLADQHRRQALGLWQKPQYASYLNGVSDPVHTPVIDQFAQQSLVLSQCCSSTPVCSPHRGMLFSGMFPHSNGVPWNCRVDRDWGLIRDTESLAKVLGRNGYSCGYIGKWHLDKPEPNDPANPGKYVAESSPNWTGPIEHSMDSYTPAEDRQGFDFWYAYGTDDDHANPHYYDNDGKRHEPGIWATIHETDVAIDYLKNTSNQRDSDNPFCLFVSTHPPHPDYADLEDTDPEMYHKHYSLEKVANVDDLLNRPNRHNDHLPMKMVYSSNEQLMKGKPGKGLSTEVVRYYYSSISGVDRQFGRLLKTLDELGMSENTIVVYTSDHGEMMGSHGLMSKSTAYEEALGIPMIVRYPETIKPGVNDVLMGSMDFMPTLLGLAGLNSEIPTSVDGQDLTPHLLGTAAKESRPTSIPYLLHTEQKGLRTDRYTFVINKEGEGVLFDNSSDPYQMNNLFGSEKEVVKKLGKELGQWLRKGDDLWFQMRINKDLIDYV